MYIIIKNIIIILLIIYIIDEIKNSLNPSKYKDDKISPKISIFLPIYNKESYIKTCIQSIQKQTLKDIEIVAVNDFSNDTSLKILKDLSLKDERIKIVNNKKNFGLLYSRTMGILNSKGEYLLNLDPDDELKDENDLEIIYKKAKNNNIDILSFGAFDKNINKKVFKCTNFGKIIFQPEIFKSIFNSDNSLNDYLIWNKLIKKELLIKVYKLIIIHIYKKYWNYHEDNIWSIFVNKYARSKICIKKIIYLYNNNNDSLMRSRFERIEIINLLYRHEIFNNIFTKENEKKYLISEIMELILIFETKKRFLKLIKQEYIREKYINIFIDLCNNYKLSKTNNNKIYSFFRKT